MQVPRIPPALQAVPVRARGAPLAKLMIPETVQRLKCDYAGLLADRGDHADAIRHYRTLAPPARRRPYLQYAL